MADGSWLMAVDAWSTFDRVASAISHQP